MIPGSGEGCVAEDCCTGGALAQAILGAISEAFKTPEVVAMFARRQPNELRQRYHELERDYRLQKLPADAFHIGAVEILVALKKLGEEVCFFFFWGGLNSFLW